MAAVTDPQPRAALRDDPLVARAFDARQLALDRLIELRSPEGNWPLPIDLNAILGATYIIMLRTTGLIEESGAFEREASLLRRMIQQVNPDGGFYKFATSPSSKCLSRVCVASLRLALGEVAPGHRPASWFRRNPSLDGALESRLHSTLSRAEHFVAHGQPGTRREFEHELRLLAPLLVAHADVGERRPWLPLLSPALSAAVMCTRRLSWLTLQLHYQLRAMWPALSILHAATRGRRERPQERAIQRLAQRIRDGQDARGGWPFNAFYTALNLMALVEAGAPADEPALRRAHAHMLSRLHPARDGGVFFDAFGGDVGNTGYGVDSRLRVSGCRCADDGIRPSVEFLLRSQRSDGAHPWGGGCQKGAEADASAHILRGLVAAACASDGQLRGRIEFALRQGARYILSRQAKGGGFSCWDTTFVGGRRGPFGVPTQVLFDVPTADVTGRIVEVLATMGMGPGHPALRRALRFLLKTQCRNGAWWSRWWAGYLVGTSFVLRAYGNLGLRWGHEPTGGDRLVTRSHQALTVGARFLLQHQNDDGGWGETIRSDEDARFAGQGESTPLHTAYLVSTLLRIGYPVSDPVVARAIEYLLSTMSPDGRWHDRQVTFTIFARSLYYRFEFLNYVLPLDALTEFLQASGAEPRVDATIPLFGENRTPSQ